MLWAERASERPLLVQHNTDDTQFYSGQIHLIGVGIRNTHTHTHIHTNQAVGEVLSRMIYVCFAVLSAHECMRVMHDGLLRKASQPREPGATTADGSKAFPHITGKLNVQPAASRTFDKAKPRLELPASQQSHFIFCCSDWIQFT